jgi:hypothetical protein
MFDETRLSVELKCLETLSIQPPCMEGAHREKESMYVENKGQWSLLRHHNACRRESERSTSRFYFSA